MFISSAPKQYYASDEHRLHSRGTPEYNPLYDTFQSDMIHPQVSNESDFRSMTSTKPRYVQTYQDEIDSTYDKPRSYRVKDEVNQNANGQRQNPSRYQQNVGEKSAQMQN